MPPRRTYPLHSHEKHWGPKKRAWMYEQEVAAFGNPQKRLVGDDSEKEDDGHYHKDRWMRSGVRPLLKVHNERFKEHLTERQRRRGKVRIARSWGRMMEAMTKSAMTMEQFVETLTPEELVRGRLKDKNGTFRGTPPAWVPQEFHRACIRELMRRGKTLWQTNYLEAIEAMTQVAKGAVKGATVRDRLVAAQFVIERIEGKQPEMVVLTEEAPWQMVIEDIVAQVPDEAIAAARKARQDLGFPDEQDILDAEILDEEEISEKPAPPRRPRRAARRAR